MRISDWSSDVCSSDLNLLKCLTSGKLTSKYCSAVLAVPTNLLKLQQLCKKAENSKLELCKVISSLPDLGGLPTGTSSGARANGPGSKGVEDLINTPGPPRLDRQRVGLGKRMRTTVDQGVRRYIKKKKK